MTVSTDTRSIFLRLPRLRAGHLLGGMAVSLTLLLGACGSSTSTATSTTSGTYTLTVTLSGVSAAVPVTVTNASGSSTYTLASGGVISGLYGSYSVSVGAVSGYTTPAAQTVALTSANGALTFTYTSN